MLVEEQMFQALTNASTSSFNLIYSYEMKTNTYFLFNFTLENIQANKVFSLLCCEMNPGNFKVLHVMDENYE